MPHIKSLLSILITLIFVMPIKAKDNFEYLSKDGHQIITLHRLKYKMEATSEFTILKPKHRTAIFKGVPYEISLSAFISNHIAVMVHAERVADASGASDYSDKNLVKWPNEKFRSDGAECMALPYDAIQGEHDLEWLRENGFEPSGNILFSQYFLTTEDFNDEIVISIILHVNDCNNNVANMELLQKIQTKLIINTTD